MSDTTQEERAMALIDLRPAARRAADLVAAAPDELSAPTPCPNYSLGDLLDHIGGLALAFAGAAAKTNEGAKSQPPSGDASRLTGDWRTRIPRDLLAMADAWRNPDAWTGMTRAGGVDLPGEVAGVVALDELVIHGWDLARATGQPYTCDDESLEALLGFVVPLAAEPEAQREGLFGPVVAVPDGAPLLDRVLGLTGRDPGWQAGVSIG